MTKRDTEIRDQVAEVVVAGAFRRQIMFWFAAAVVFVAFLYVFSSVLLPFFAGMILAYFLDPVADRFERWGMSRLAATVLILVLFVVMLALGLMLVIPILASQAVEFLGRLPDYLSRLQTLVTSFDPEWIGRTVGVDPQSLREGLTSLLQQGTGFITGLFSSLV